MTFASPVSITAGTTYVASYHTSGYYSATQGQFSGAGVDNAPLHAPADAAGARQRRLRLRRRRRPSRPSTYASTNYSVDVVFNDGVDTTKPTVTSTDAGVGGHRCGHVDAR